MNSCCNKEGRRRGVALLAAIMALGMFGYGCGDAGLDPLMDTWTGTGTLVRASGAGTLSGLSAEMTFNPQLTYNLTISRAGGTLSVDSGVAVSAVFTESATFTRMGTTSGTITTKPNSQVVKLATESDTPDLTSDTMTYGIVGTSMTLSWQDTLGQFGLTLKK